MKVSAISIFSMSTTTTVLVTIHNLPENTLHQYRYRYQWQQGQLAGLQIGNHQALNFAYNPMGLEQQRLNGLG
ncbi:hypothetical protein ABDK09_01995 [Vibrio sp. CDRSL-10 TSBA]